MGGPTDIAEASPCDTADTSWQSTGSPLNWGGVPAATAADASNARISRYPVPMAVSAPDGTIRRPGALGPPLVSATVPPVAADGVYVRAPAAVEELPNTAPRAVPAASAVLTTTRFWLSAIDPTPVREPPARARLSLTVTPEPPLPSAATPDSVLPPNATLSLMVMPLPALDREATRVTALPFRLRPAAMEMAEPPLERADTPVRALPPRARFSAMVMPEPALAREATPVRALPPMATFSAMVMPDPAFAREATPVMALPPSASVSVTASPAPPFPMEDASTAPAADMDADTALNDLSAL